MQKSVNAKPFFINFLRKYLSQYYYMSFTCFTFILSFVVFRLRQNFIKIGSPAAGIPERRKKTTEKTEKKSLEMCVYGISWQIDIYSGQICKYSHSVECACLSIPMEIFLSSHSIRINYSCSEPFSCRVVAFYFVLVCCQTTKEIFNFTQNINYVIFDYHKSAEKKSY